MRLAMAKKMVFIISFFIILLIMSACSSLDDQLSQGGEGKIVLTLSRGADLTELTPIDGQDAVPRDHRRVQENISSYVVRIDGDLDAAFLQEITLPEDSDSLTTAIEVLAGQSYSITLLALGPGNNPAQPVLLAAGRAETAVVNAGEITSVPVHMYAYKYIFEKEICGGFYQERIPVNIELRGPFLEEVLFWSPEEHPLEEPPTDFPVMLKVAFGEQDQAGEALQPEADFIDDPLLPEPELEAPHNYRPDLNGTRYCSWGLAAYIYTSDLPEGLNESDYGTNLDLYFQLRIPIREEWNPPGKEIQFLVPASSVNDDFIRSTIYNEAY